MIAARECVRASRQSHPILGRWGGEVEAWRHDPNDNGALVVEQELAPDDCRIGSEAAQPQSVAQEHRWLAAGEIVGSGEGAPEDRSSTERL